MQHFPPRFAIGSILVAALPLMLGGAAACGSSSADDAPTNGVEGEGGAGSPDGPSSLGTDGASPTPDGGGPAGQSHIKTVFIILMENHSWETVKKSDSAPYINKTLVPMGAHAEQYFTPPGLHPSEPNYIWLEAGDNLGITTDDDPDNNHKAEKDHLVTQLEAKGVTWKAYAEDIDGKSCPLASSGKFGAKHTPQLFFDDVTDTNKADSKKCIEHIRPYPELEVDLGSNKVAQYNFITPNLCNDMHGEASFDCPFNPFGDSQIKHGDDWLAAHIPKILASNAYKDGGAVFIVFDEGDEPLGGDASDGPIPMIVLSPLAKPNFASNTKFTHSSMLRTIQTIFGVPFLRDAQKAKDLSEMFTAFP
jgi:phosphatidylinositol-3-phosphatase